MKCGTVDMESDNWFLVQLKFALDVTLGYKLGGMGKSDITYEQPLSDKINLFEWNRYIYED